MNIFNTIYSILAFIFTVLLIGLVTLIFYFSSPLKTTKIVVVPKGSITHVVEALKKQGYPLTKLDTYCLAYILKAPKSGTLIIGEAKMSHINFLKKLSSAKEAIDVITLIPGETKTIFFQELAKDKNLSLSKLNQYYNEFSTYKEAGILPETYHVSKEVDEKSLIKTLISQTEKAYETMAKEAFKSYDKRKWNRVLTIASIIQKEAANNEEMPIVASVIYNRLKRDMPLQMDGTLNYGKFSHIKVTPKRIREDKSGFNTYLNSGLPPYPVCSVSTQAINAALHPKTTNYLYFMKNKKGVHDFTHSYQEHLRNISRAK